LVLLIYFSKGFWGMFIPPDLFAPKPKATLQGTVNNDSNPLLPEPSRVSVGGFGDVVVVKTPARLVPYSPITITPSVTPTSATPTPTITLSADTAVTPSPQYQTLDFLYSYYYPPLGGVNCHSNNWTGSTCADTTASGAHWSDYVGRGLAVPPSWFKAGLGFGSIVRVLSPDVLAGDYTVIDICCGCEADNWTDGQFRFDFLDDAQKLQWAYPIHAEIFNLVKSPQTMPDCTEH
jgi:hypothetical protein